MRNDYICNMTEEEHGYWEDVYMEWEYQKYCDVTERPLPMNEWLKQFKSSRNA